MEKMEDQQELKLNTERQKSSTESKPPVAYHWRGERTRCSGKFYQEPHVDQSRGADS